MVKTKVEMQTQKCPMCGRLVNNGDLLKKGITEVIVKQMHEASSEGILATVITFGLKIVRVIEPNLKPAFNLKKEQEELRKLLKEVGNILETAKGKITAKDLQHIEETQKKILEIREEQLTREIEWKRILTALHTEHERLLGTPWISGKYPETQILRRLRTISPSDRFSIKQATRGGIDIVCQIIENGKKVGKIVIESKNTKNWDNQFIEQVKKYQKDESTPYTIIATKTLPPEALNDKVENWLFSNNIWIVKHSYCEFAYLAYRKVITEVSERESDLEEKLQTIEKHSRVINALEKIVTTKDLKEVAYNVQQAIDFSLKSDTEVDGLVKYISRKQKKLGELQKKLRKYLSEALERNQTISKKLRKLLS